MNPAEPVIPTHPLSADELHRIDLVCDDFERAWLQGLPPDIEAYLPRLEAPLRPALDEELLRLDLEWRCRKGEVLPVEVYRQRYPRHAEALPDWLAEARTVVFSDTPLPETRSHQPPTGAETPSDNPPTSQPSAVGLPRLLGECELVRLLGAGGMGEVYEGRHRQLGKRVAVKLLPVGRHASRDALERFSREIKAVGSLEHPHLVEAHDAGEQDGVVYRVLKYLDGIDLKQLVERDGPLPVAEACELVRQAALGLQYLHERGLVHRDVKPSNLMLVAPASGGREPPVGTVKVPPVGTVKVLDLGLARWRKAAGAEGDLTDPGQFMGTPDYLAPEQAEDAARADIRADLYGLGCTLFYLLTGRAPFAHHKS
jgi:hypothetical protein